MTRLSVSPELAAHIAWRIERFCSEASQTHQWLVPNVAEFNALPLYLGWTETLGIRPDGEIIRWSTEGDYAGILPVEERSWLLIALVAGADRYPELGQLLPVRGPDAVDCRCRAIPLCVSGEVVCSECGGLGWLPGPEVPECS